MKTNREFGVNLKKLRKRKGMSQTIFAEMVNEQTGAKLRHNVISNYENGLTMPSLGLVPTMASILNTSVDFLLGVTSNTLNGDDTSTFSAEERLKEIKAQSINLQPFLHVPRVDASSLTRAGLEGLVEEQYDLIDQLLKEVTRLKDDNINTKEKLLNLREKFESFMGK